MYMPDNADKNFAERDKILTEIGIKFTKNYCIEAYGLTADDFQTASESSIDINHFISLDNKFNVQAFKRAIYNKRKEHAILLNNEEELVTYAVGDKTSADFTSNLIDILTKDKNYNSSILLPKDEALKRYNCKEAFSDEALNYLRNNLKLKGGCLIHNHPEDCPLTVSDIMSGIYLELSSVEAICINKKEYNLQINTNLKLTNQEIAKLKNKLLFVEKFSSIISNIILYKGFKSVFLIMKINLYIIL